MNQLPPIDTLYPGARLPGPAAEPHLRRAAELTTELIDLVARLRGALAEPAGPPSAERVPEPASRRGLAPGEMRDAFAAATAAPRRQPRELTVAPPHGDGPPGLSAS